MATSPSMTGLKRGTVGTLRACFASRSSCCAEDDSGWEEHDCTVASIFRGGEPFRIILHSCRTHILPVVFTRLLA
jgi:hypothetical protein